MQVKEKERKKKETDFSGVDVKYQRSSFMCAPEKGLLCQTITSQVKNELSCLKDRLNTFEQTGNKKLITTFWMYLKFDWTYMLSVRRRRGRSPRFFGSRGRNRATISKGVHWQCQLTNKLLPALAWTSSYRLGDDVQTVGKWHTVTLRLHFMWYGYD